MNKEKADTIHADQTRRRDLTFRVFVSSTFSDLKSERNALQQTTFPRLREYCRQRGARFQAIDLRWGVSQEAALDQQTMNICFAELARCQELSPKPNFIVLLGQRYGWRPLPATIPANVLEAIRSRLTAKDSNSTMILDAWYRRDDNAVPPEYVLQPRTGRFEDFSVWESEVECPLMAALDEAAAELLSDATLPAPLREDLASVPIGLSATHQEILHGAFQASEAEKHVFAYLRDIEDAPVNDPEEAIFIDRGADKYDLDELKTSLKQKLPENNIFPYKSLWQDIKRRNQDASPQLHLDREPDLKQLCDRVFEDLRRVIDSEICVFRKHEPSPADCEAEEHLKFGSNLRQHFVGRSALLDRICNYVANGDHGRPLIITGPSGSGKSALMAEGFRRSTESPGVDYHVARFIGATPDSTVLRLLLHDLCQALGVVNLPEDTATLVRVFRCRLAPLEERSCSPPVMLDKSCAVNIPNGGAVVFLDGLDRLQDVDHNRLLDWLPRQLASNVRLVISMLDGVGNDREEMFRSPSPYAVAKHAWGADVFTSLGRLRVSEARFLLGKWLMDVKRCLQKEQEREILSKFLGNGSPLFLRLAFEEVCRWHSWDISGQDGLPCLGTTVPKILSERLNELERPANHGRLMVAKTLGYLCAARHGLTEDELLDVLSRDVQLYMEFVCNAHQLPSDLRWHFANQLAGESGRKIAEVTEQEINDRLQQLGEDLNRFESFIAELIRTTDEQARQVDKYILSQLQHVALQWMQDRVETPRHKPDAFAELFVSPGAHDSKLPQLPRLPVVTWSRLRDDLGNYLMERRADGTSVLSFRNDQTRQVVAARYLANQTENRQAHEHLAEYFLHKDDLSCSYRANSRKISELPHHLEMSGDEDRLYAYLRRFITFVSFSLDNRIHEIGKHWQRLAHRSTPGTEYLGQWQTAYRQNSLSKIALLEIGEKLTVFLIGQNDFICANALAVLCLDVAGDVAHLNDYAIGARFAIGRCALEIGDSKTGQNVYEEIIKLLEDCGDMSPTEQAKALDSLGWAYRLDGRHDAAVMLCRRGLKLHEQWGTATDIAQSMNNLGVCLQARGDYNEAFVELFDAMTMRLKLLGPADTQTALTMANLASALESCGDTPEAQRHLLAAWAVQKRVLGYKHPRVLATLGQLVALQRRRIENGCDEGLAATHDAVMATVREFPDDEAMDVVRLKYVDLNYALGNQAIHGGTFAKAYLSLHLADDLSRQRDTNATAHAINAANTFQNACNELYNTAFRCANNFRLAYLLALMIPKTWKHYDDRIYRILARSCLDAARSSIAAKDHAGALFYSQAALAYDPESHELAYSVKQAETYFVTSTGARLPTLEALKTDVDQMGILPIMESLDDQAGKANWDVQEVFVGLVAIKEREKRFRKDFLRKYRQEGRTIPLVALMMKEVSGDMRKKN